VESQASWIKYLSLIPHPEGGYYSENYRSGNEYIDLKYSGPRNLATSIYYMLDSNQVSKLHRLKSDEIWYFHYGSPLRVHVFNTNSYDFFTLGTNFRENQLLQLVIPAGAIFGAEVLEQNSFTILGCMVSPGFHFNDFELIRVESILANFPALNSVIQKLT